MLNYKQFNYARKIILNDLEKVMKKINLLAINGKFKKREKTEEILANMLYQIDIQKRVLKYNDHLWENNYELS